ncbi:MAG: hypothetical protein GXP31_04330 [Kiritimatiellaeota bacterium]|nr:hypothetical protein [Kiritimatiellota bacterium]
MPAVAAVTGDQQRLRAFIEALPTNINEMDTAPDFIRFGPGTFRARGKRGTCYVACFLLEPGRKQPAGRVGAALPPGRWHADWLDPKTGVVVASAAVRSTAASAEIPHTGFAGDIVLRIVAAPDSTK